MASSRAISWAVTSRAALGREQPSWPRTGVMPSSLHLSSGYPWWHMHLGWRRECPLSKN